MYCPYCGHETEQIIPVAAPVADAIDREVEIARINAERDVKVAQISARGERDWNETRVEVAEIEADAEVEAAAVEAEIISEAIEASDVPPAEPIEIIAPETIPDDETEDAPPETEEGSEAPDSGQRKVGLGMW
jgi:hypothetical protein